jgi:hypothetical protein
MNVTTVTQTSPYGAAAVEPAPATAPPDSTGETELRQQMIEKANLFNLLFALECAQQDAAMLEGTSRVEEQGETIRQKITELQEQLRLAREAAEDKGFWDSIVGVAKAVGTVAAATAALASVVASGGVTAPAALALGGVLISVAGTEVAAELGASPEVLMALQLGGAALGGAGAAMQLFGTAATAAGAAARTAEQVGSVASGVQGGAAVVEGYGGYRSGSAAADGVEHHANADTLRAEQRRQQRYQTQLLDVLAAINESLSSAKQYLVDARNEYTDGSLVLAGQRA